QHWDDVRLLQRRDRTDLSLEPLGAQALREVGRQHFHHDSSLEPELFGDEDAAHAAAAKLALQAVRVTERFLELVSQRGGPGSPRGLVQEGERRGKVRPGKGMV